MVITQQFSFQAFCGFHSFHLYCSVAVITLHLCCPGNKMMINDLERIWKPEICGSVLDATTLPQRGRTHTFEEWVKLIFGINWLKIMTASRVGVVCTMNKDVSARPLCACSCIGFKNDIMGVVAFWVREFWINTILKITYKNGKIFSLTVTKYVTFFLLWDLAVLPSWIFLKKKPFMAVVD